VFFDFVNRYKKRNKKILPSQTCLRRGFGKQARSAQTVTRQLPAQTIEVLLFLSGLGFSGCLGWFKKRKQKFYPQALLGFFWLTLSGSKNHHRTYPTPCLIHFHTAIV